MSAKAVEPAYTPITQHGELTKVLDDVYIVEGSFNLALGLLVQRTMTIVKRGNDLTIINSIRLNEAVEAELKKLGTVKHVVRMSPAHGCDDGYYLDTFEPVTYWSLEGVTAKPGVRAHDKVLGADGEFPVPEMKVLVLKNTKAPECVLWTPDNGGTVISCDFIQNVGKDVQGHSNWIGSFASSMVGFKGECKCVPLWRSIHGQDHWDDVETLLSWDFENLISAHGQAKVGGAKSACEQGLKESFGKK